MYQDREVIKELEKLLRWTHKKGMKVGGLLGKLALLATMNKVPDTEKNREGKRVINMLAKSKDELMTATLDKSQLGIFKEKAKELGITYASIGNKDKGKVRIIFKAKDEKKIIDAINKVKEAEKNIKKEENVAKVTDEMEDVANKLDSKEEKEAYDLLANLNFKEVGENVYRQEEVMTPDQIVSMKEELEKKGIKSEVVVMEVVDDGKYKVDFKIRYEDKEKIKKPLDELIEGVLHQKENNAEIGRMIEETKNNPYSFYEEPERKERFEKMVKSKEDLTTISVHQKNVLDFEREANKNGITTIPIEKDDGKYTKMLIEKGKEKEAKKILNKIKERGEMER